MRSYIPAYELRAPAILTALLELLAREPGVWRPFAGGTDLMVLLEAGKLDHRKFVSLQGLRELRRIEVSPEYVTMGAATTYSDVQRSATMQSEFSLLCRAAAETGSIATQNRGTLGGNIANASPAADSPPALLVYDAELQLISAGGTRWTPYREFHTGYKRMNMRPNELIGGIRMRRGGDRWKTYFRKVGPRKAQAISKVCFAGAANVRGGKIEDIRIALGSVAPMPLRCVKTEAVLRGRRLDEVQLRAAREELAREIAPIDDMRSSARYRGRVAANLLAEFLEMVGAG
jgi:CO/xanthine dehydrogenase FAD-binding subunit